MLFLPRVLWVLGYLTWPEVLQQYAPLLIALSACLFLIWMMSYEPPKRR